MGYSLVLVKEKQLEMLAMNVLRLNPKLDNYQRLKLIHHTVSDLISQFQPDCFAIEAPFFGKNVQSMLKLGRAQGVAIAAAMNAGLEVFEYSPKKVKQSITGNGNAAKEQVCKMLQTILVLEKNIFSSLDASDALAVAVCHHFQQGLTVKANGKKVNGWKDFVGKNPARVR